MTDQKTAPLAASLAIEQTSTQIRAHVLSVINGLLQTPDYAAAIARAVGTNETSDEYVQWNIDQRRHRQRRVINSDMTLHALTPEHALRSRIGDDGVMAAQMRHLLKMAELPNVTIQVVPFEIGQYEAERIGSFSLHTLPMTETPMVNLQTYGGYLLTDDAEEVAYFIDAFNQAETFGLPPKESAQFIDKTRKEWETKA